jgi:hypothetical protein
VGIWQVATVPVVNGHGNDWSSVGVNVLDDSPGVDLIVLDVGVGAAGEEHLSVRVSRHGHDRAAVVLHCLHEGEREGNISGWKQLTG